MGKQLLFLADDIVFPFDKSYMHFHLVIEKFRQIILNQIMHLKPNQLLIS